VRLGDELFVCVSSSERVNERVLVCDSVVEKVLVRLPEDDGESEDVLLELSVLVVLPEVDGEIDCDTVETIVWLGLWLRVDEAVSEMLADCVRVSLTDCVSDVEYDTVAVKGSVSLTVREGESVIELL